MEVLRFRSGHVFVQFIVWTSAQVTQGWGGAWL